MKHLVRWPLSVPFRLLPGRRTRAEPQRSAPPSRRAGEDGGAPSPGERDFECLVRLSMRAAQLLDRALAETYVGEDALAQGDELKATQHFGFGGHYRRRAQEVEADLERRLAAIAAASARRALREGAWRAARQRLYGSAELERRPRFE